MCDPCGFGPSLSACPKLQQFNSYKLRGLELRDHSAHHLILPNCASLSLWCADDLNRIEIEAPQLECLNLQVLLRPTQCRLPVLQPPKSSTSRLMYLSSQLHSHSSTDMSWSLWSMGLM